MYTNNAPAAVSGWAHVFFMSTGGVAKVWTEDDAGNISIQSAHENDERVDVSWNRFSGRCIKEYKDRIRELEMNGKPLTTNEYQVYYLPKSQCDSWTANEQAQKDAVDNKIVQWSNNVAAYAAFQALPIESKTNLQALGKVPDEPGIKPTPYAVRPEPEWVKPEDFAIQVDDSKPGQPKSVLIKMGDSWITGHSSMAKDDYRICSWILLCIIMLLLGHSLYTRRP